MFCPAQDEKKSSTNGRPLKVNKKQMVTEMINAITWFFVRADIQEPIDKYAPAISKLPKYPAIITPLSGFPK